MVNLKETNIEDLENFDWVAYFEYNNAHLLKLDYTKHDELTKEDIKCITPSIRAFQIGEGSEGKNLKKRVKNYVEKTKDDPYEKAMDWFVIEENRHSQTLKKYMEIYDIQPKLMGLECEVIVLVTAEMIALSYYTALSNATNSTLLKTICKQMLQDELKHVVFQSYTLHKISRKRNKILNTIVRAIRKGIMRITLQVVWIKYKELFIKGGYSKKQFKEDSVSYLNQSIQIEKNGKIL